jgi:hypothetical protein
MVRLQSRRRLTIVHSVQKRVVSSMKEYSVQIETSSVTVVNTSGIRYKGIVCEKCGVEITRSIVRRDRMGHIEPCFTSVTHLVPSQCHHVLVLSYGID